MRATSVMRFVVFAAVGFGILLGLYMAIAFARVVLPNCGEQEKAALAEFPQYGGRVAGEDLDIEGDELNWPPLEEPPPGCAVGFTTPQAFPEQVLRYYEEELIQHGWTVKRFPPIPRDGPDQDAHLEASRDSLRYSVAYFELPDIETTNIGVHVYKPPLFSRERWAPAEPQPRRVR